MTGLDPDAAAAAAAWLGQLPAATRAPAEADTAWSETASVFQILIVLGLCAFLLRGGFLSRVRAWCEARGLSGWTADVACAAAFGLLILLTATPIAAISFWRLAPEDWLELLLHNVRGGLTLVVLASAPAPLVLFLVRRAPKAWGVILGAALAVLAFAAVWLPYAGASGPAPLPTAPPGAAREAVLELVRDTRTPASEVYISGYDGVDADVTGSAEHARVVVSRGLWAKASPSELRASVGHVIGHYRHGDQRSLAILIAALVFATFFGVQLLAPPLARRLGLDGPGDPAALPLLAALFIAFSSLGVVVEHGFIRAINVRADQFSLDNAREPDGLAVALLREWKGERVDPSPLEEAIFYDHPSLQSRLVHAMSWKRAHPGPAGPSPGRADG